MRTRGTKTQALERGIKACLLHGLPQFAVMSPYFFHALMQETPGGPELDRMVGGDVYWECPTQIDGHAGRIRIRLIVGDKLTRLQVLTDPCGEAART